MLEALRLEMGSIVTQRCTEPTQRDVVLGVLSLPGFGLHPESELRAGALTLSSYEATAGPPTGAAVHAAAAVELLMEAGFLLDHLADREVDESCGLSPAEQLAVAVTMLTCSSTAAVEAVALAGPPAGLHEALGQFHQNFITACAGQLTDLRLEHGILPTTEEAAQVTAQKAGSLGKLAAEFGAAIALAEPGVVRQIGALGSNLLTYLQVLDDIRDACGEDFAQNKKTLPLVFYYRSQSEPGIQGAGSAPRDWQNGDGLHNALEASGATTFAAIIAEAHLNEAKRVLADLGRRGLRTGSLEQLITSLENAGALVQLPS